MNKVKYERLLSGFLAVLLAFGTMAVLPAGFSDTTGLDLGITADAASSDFTYSTDSDGNKYISGYTGKGGDITLPKGVYVGENAFKENTNITSVTFPESYKVKTNAFLGCTALKKVVFKGDATIFEKAFSYCINLESVTIKGNLVNGLGYRAFAGCQSLKTFKVTKDECMGVIGVNAFENCYSLTSVTIPSKFTWIAQEAFLNCFNLKSVTIPENTGIDEKAFGYAMGSKENEYQVEYFVADGKTRISYESYTTNGSLAEMAIENMSKVFAFYDNTQIPQKLTLTVTKGSDAETYAKTNGVAYKYASGSKTTSTVKTQDVAFTAKATANKIVLKWDEFADADAYIVYKYNASTKKYEKYKSVSTAKCTVTGLSAKTSYKFKVVAVKKSGGKYTAVAQSKGVTVKTKAKTK